MSAAATSSDRRTDAPTPTRTHGRWRALLRSAWVLGLLVTLVPALASFIYLAQNQTLELLSRAGAFAIRPSIANGLEDLGFAHEILLRADLVFRVIGMSVFAGTAILIFLRRSKDWMTALVSFTLLALGTTWFAPVGALPSGSILESVAGFVGTPRPFDVELGKLLTGPTIMLFLFLFPDGRFVPGWTRYAAAGLGIHFLVWNLFEGSFVDPTTSPDWAQAVIVSLILGCGLFAQTYRYFKSDSAQRRQTGLIVAAIYIVALVPVLLFILNPGLGAGLEGLAIVTPRVEAIYNLILLVALALAMLLFPLSIAVSVVRYRLWDIDLFINRTLVYGALTGVLGLAYFAILAVVSSVASQSYVTAAAATLGVAVLFQPARRRLQDLIDKRFYRRRYDATQRLQGFAWRLRQEIDLQTLTTELLRTVEETMQPTGVSLWVVRSERDTDVMRRIGFWVAGGPPAIRGQDFDTFVLDSESRRLLREVDEPLDLDEAEESCEALTRLRSVDIRLTVPLVSQGELIGMLNLGPRMSETGYSSDDLKLLDDLSDHAAAAVRVALLVNEREASMRERERIENEMHVARLIQQRFFPKELPQIEGWEIYGYLQAARDVGGDFYDFIELPDGKLVIVAGDVTGKGVPAALVMASTRSLMRSEAPRLRKPAAILAHVNDVLLSDIPEQMFVTCLCAVLDPSSGRLEFANAGHNVPYIRSDVGVVESRATGLPLGLMPGVTYDQSETTIAPGTTVVLHSDGLAEARNSSGEMFGFPRVKSSLENCALASETIDHLLSELGTFAGDDWEQDDDITLAVIHRKAVDEGLSRRTPVGADAVPVGLRMGEQ